jgi:hypothetical protein
MTSFEWDCYGTSVESIRKDYIDSVTARLTGIEMVIMSVMSDAQYLMELKAYDEARKAMNIAKFILGEQLKSKMAA